MYTLIYMCIFYKNKHKGIYMKTIEGRELRRLLRAKKLPYGDETTCCGGRVKYNTDYKKQLSLLGMSGEFSVKENGIIVAFIKID